MLQGEETPTDLLQQPMKYYKKRKEVSPSRFLWFDSVET
jgi:hypothetical protein